MVKGFQRRRCCYCGKNFWCSQDLSRVCVKCELVMPSIAGKQQLVRAESTKLHSQQREDQTHDDPSRF